MTHSTLSQPCREDDDRRCKIHNLWCGAMGFNGTTRIAAVETNSAFADATPLLGKDGSIPVLKTADSEKRPLEIDGTRVAVDVSQVTLARISKFSLVFLTASSCLAVSIWSFVVAPATVLYVMGGMCLLNFALVTCSEWRILLTGGWTMKAIDHIRDIVDNLDKEKSSLEDHVETLTKYASKFSDVEHELQVLAQAQGSTIDRCLELLRINGETMNMMRENLRQKVIEDVIEIILRRIANTTQIIDRVEARLIALKIAVKLELYGIIFDEEKFLKVVALNPTLMGVTRSVRKLLPPAEECDDICSGTSDQDDIFDMFYMARPDQNEIGSTVDGIHDSLASRCSAPDCRHVSLGRS